MNQYVSFQEVRLYVRVRFVKMRKDLLFFLVIKFNPLMMLDPQMLNFLIDTEVSKRPFVDDRQDRLNMILLHFLKVVEDVDSTQKEVSFLDWRIAFLFEDIDDVTANSRGHYCKN
jgi:hypothetical protein